MDIYFDSIGGDDTGAGTIISPYKSIAKLNSVFTTVVTGSTFYLKRDSVWTGSTITISKSGTVGGGITIDAYGTGEKPLISGFQTVTGWTDMGGNIWESSATSCANSLIVVTFDGEVAQMGRYPNADTFLTYESFSGTTSITDNQLSASPNWTGAEVVIRNNGYSGQKRTITNHSGTTITYAGGNSYDMKNGYGYFIQNDIRTLDTDKEWFLNKSTKKISMYFADNNPTLHTIKASIVDYTILSTNRNYITFNNLQAEGGNESNLYLNETSSGYTVSYCDFNLSGTYGVLIGISTNLNFHHNTISNSLSKGMLVQNAVSGAIIEYNTINNTGLLFGMNKLYYSPTAIEPTGTGMIIQYNNITNTGFHGIFPRGQNNIIRYNLVSNFGLTLDDCGGIYIPTEQTGNQVINNIVLYGIGNWTGTNYTGSHAEGIYLDEISANTYLEGNTIAHCGSSGIRYHNAYNIIASGNTMYNNMYNIHIIKSSSDPTHSRNLTFLNNIMFAKTSNQFTFRIYNYVADNPLLFGTAESNYYCRPISEGSTIQTRNVSTIVNYTLDTWKAATSGDTLSHISPFTIISSDDILFDYNASTSNKVVNDLTGWFDLNNISVKNYTLTPYTSILLIKSLVYYIAKGGKPLLKNGKIVTKNI